MSEFILYTHGSVPKEGPNGSVLTPTKWTDLDAFTQGYIEAMLFTNCSDPDDGDLEGKAYADLSTQALADIVMDCHRFQEVNAGTLAGVLAQDIPQHVNRDLDEASAGRDFWFTRNGHGIGFWDGDWPEPYATALTKACKAFGEVDVYLGDDGLVYLG